LLGARTYYVKPEHSYYVDREVDGALAAIVTGDLSVRDLMAHPETTLRAVALVSAVS